MLSLASRLIERGHFVVVVPPYEGYVSGRCRDMKIPHVVLESNRRLDLSLMRRLRNVVADIGAELIHAHGLDAAVYASASGIGGIPVLGTVHGAMELQKGGPLRMWAKGRLLRLAGMTLVTVSDDLRRKVTDRGFLRAERVVTIHNGVEFAYANTGVDSERLRASLGIPDSAIVVGAVANARAEKGYGRFLEAAVRISRVRPDVRFVLAGELAGEGEARVRNNLEQMGLEQNVHLLGFRYDIERIFAMLDVFVLASDTEGFSLVTVEAMGHRKPVVATRCGGPEEIIEDGKTGFLVEMDEGGAIAERVLWLLDNLREARRMGERGAESVRNRFNIRRMIIAYERLYERLIQERN